MRPFHAQHEFNVSSPTVAWQARKETRSTFFAFTGGSLDRYDNTTYAYYEATVPTSATMNGDFAARAKHWGRPEEAVVHMYQSAYWGNWGFNVDSVDLSNTAKPVVHWSFGGFQEARGGTTGATGSRGIHQVSTVSITE